MIRVDVGSARHQAAGHQVAELLEQVARVVRPGRGLRVVLHRERGHVQAAQPLERAVVQVPMGEPRGAVVGLARGPAASTRVHPCGSTAKPWLWLVISTAPVREILDGLVHAPMPEPHLVRAPAKRQPEQLMAQADPEDRAPCRAARAPPRSRTGSTAGSPGPFDRNTPSNPPPAISAGGVSAGNTVASIPSPRAAEGCSASCRSRTPPPGTPRRARSRRPDDTPRPRTAPRSDTVLARSGTLHAAATLARARRATRHRGRRSRSRRASRRAPGAAGSAVACRCPRSRRRPRRRAASGSDAVARQLDARRDASRTANPATCTRADSASSPFIP